jgi:PAS domain S-box-containing protein
MKEASAQPTKTGTVGRSPADEMDAGLLRPGDGMLPKQPGQLKDREDATARLAAIVESSSDAIIGKDLRGIVTSWNTGAETVFGYTAAEMIGQPIARLIPADRQAEEVEILGRICAGKTIRSFDTVRVRKDGSTVPISATISPIKDAAGKIIGGSKIARDISEAKRAEASLRASEQRMRLATEATQVGIWEWNVRTNQIRWDAEMFRIYGIAPTPDGFVDYCDWSSAVLPEDLPENEAILQRTVRRCGQSKRTFRIRRRDNGECRIVDSVETVRTDAQGQAEWVMGTNLDVTERKKAERQLQDGQEQLDFALAAADLGQWALNLTDHTASRTLRHDQIFGYDTMLPEWTYEMFLEHVVPADRAAVDAKFQNSVATGLAWAVQCRIRRADGAVRHIWTKGLIRRDAGGQVDRMLGIVGDITDLRQAEGRQAFQIRLAETLRPLSEAIDVQAEASRILGEHLGANRVVYFEVRGDDYVIERDYSAGVQPLAGRYPAAAFGPALLAVLQDGRTVIEADATTELDRPPGERAAFAAIQVRGHVGVPLIKSGRFVAGMGVHVCDRRDWTRQEVALIEDTAERTWAAVERVRAEAALQQSEERLAFVRRSSGVGFWYCDLPFDLLQWDGIVKSHFHLPPDAAVTIQTFYDRIHPDDRELTRQAIEQSITQRTHYNVDYRTVNPDTGAVKWVRAIGRTFYAADGTPTRFDGVTLDVSDQKQSEAGLRESEQRFRLVADAAPVLIWVSGTDKLCNWFNQPWLAFTGRSMAEEVGNGWVEGVHPDDLDRCLQTYTAAFDARTPFSMEYRLRRNDGEFCWLNDNGVPRFRSGGEFDGYIGSCIDVTEYKNAEAGLREADRRKDEFLATLAHELRNPLAPIRSGLQVIRMVEADATIQQARSMMERQLLLMTRLVDDLLDVSRVTTGKLVLRRQRVQLRDVISAALETSRPVIEQGGHVLGVVVPAEPIFVDGDPVRLAQVVSNLLTNAAKYTHPGGHIRVSVSLDDAEAVVAVADDGIGIPTDMLESVFGMFAQVDRTLEKTTGGLGIGLSLVKGLVQMHGGTIEAFSEGEGKGSEFAVRLPVANLLVRESEPSGAEATRVEPTRTSRILIVDDNVDAANSLGQLLEMMGNEILTSYDGESGIQAAREFQPRVVLCDIGMPKMNGYDTARSIRAEVWGKNTVLVALTGYGREDDLQKSADAGFDHHLVKPVDVDALMALLADLQPQPQPQSA